MSLKQTPNGWIIKVLDRRNLTSGGNPITDLYVEYSRPDRVWLHYTGFSGVEIGEIYLPADPDTMDNLAEGIKSVANLIREDWLKRSGASDTSYKAPATGGDLNYRSK